MAKTTTQRTNQKSKLGSTEMGTHLLSQFDEYRSDRQSVQNQWEKSRENYLGIFDPSDTWKKREGNADWQSRSHMNLTKQKVTAAHAIIIDNQLRNGQVQFDLTPAPWDELTFGDVPEMISHNMRDNMHEMKRTIQQQLMESHADRAFMKNSLSLAEYGMTVSKRVVGTVQRRGWNRVIPQGIPNIDEMILSGQIPLDQFAYRPYSKTFKGLIWDYRTIWNIFWDMESGYNLQDARGYFDRDYVDATYLEERKDKKGFIKEALEAALEDAKESSNTLPDSDRASLPPYLRDLSFRKKSVQWLEYWGQVPLKKAEAFEQEMANKFKGFSPMNVAFADEDDGKTVEVLVSMAGNHVVQWVRTDRDDRPHQMAFFADELDEQGPTGVADNVKDSQKIINGAIRGIEDNTKLTGNTITAVQRRMIENMPDVLGPGAVIDISEGATSVRDAIQQFTYQDVSAGLLNLLDVIKQFGDEDSMIPKIQQGFQGQSEETAFSVAQRLESSGKYMSMVLRNTDENLVEPNIRGYYNRNMMDPRLKKGKGAYQVQAAGMQGFQNRVIQITQLQQILAVVREIPELATSYDIGKIGDKVVSSMADLSIEEFKRPQAEINEQKAAQAQAQAQAAQLAIKAQEAEINKTEAEAQAKMAEAQAELARAQKDLETVRLEKLRAVKEIQDAREAKQTAEPVQP